MLSCRSFTGFTFKSVVDLSKLLHMVKDEDQQLLVCLHPGAQLVSSLSGANSSFSEVLPCTFAENQLTLCIHSPDGLTPFSLK